MFLHELVEDRLTEVTMVSPEKIDNHCGPQSFGYTRNTMPGYVQSNNHVWLCRIDRQLLIEDNRLERSYIGLRSVTIQGWVVGHKSYDRTIDTALPNKNYVRATYVSVGVSAGIILHVRRTTFEIHSLPK